ncbi:helix-turn-helix domain-containing protein [Brevundimonas subvibrioides]|uniref:helix-turn-helix domain-containing protein n=1 Tax=Brevundimonas subvibrioides TaxID=74313 RepID=UPI0022B2BDD5|nr:helix-turn-helix domain-containing protein [Brevundimonas subvibrioides]
MLVYRRQPAAARLRGVVRGYQERTGRLSGPGVVLPLTARPNAFIEIYAATPYWADVGSGFAAVPDAVIVGPQTRRHTDLLMRGEICSFNIQFQAGGLNRLLGLPMDEMADAAHAADNVGGAALVDLRAAVQSAAGFEGRVAAAEAWLSRRMQAARPRDAVDQAADVLRRMRGAVRIDALADRAGLGERQFHRRFTAQVGVAPKLYARIVRFDAMLADRGRDPSRPWTALAQDHGYFDQSHLQRDFHAFAGTAPGGFASPLPVVRA